MATFFFVRHAKAGSRSHWTGDDRQRPLSKKGVKQAEDLVSVLGDFPISAVFSSPYRRCLETVEPLAKARLRVRLNGVEGTLHRPHHGDALGRQDILHIREYLAHAKATPSQYEAIRKG